MITNAGRDFQARVMGDPASSGQGNYASASWIALSTDVTAEDASRTTLPGEVTGGSMGRQQAAYAHVLGTDVYTLTTTFTADRQVEIAKYGVFNAQTGGSLMFEKLLDESVSLSVGETVQIVDTVDLNS